MEDGYYNPFDPVNFGSIKTGRKLQEEQERRQEMTHISEHVHLTQIGSQIVPLKTRPSPWNR